MAMSGRFRGNVGRVDEQLGAEDRCRGAKNAECDPTQGPTRANLVSFALPVPSGLTLTWVKVEEPILAWSSPLECHHAAGNCTICVFL